MLVLLATFATGCGGGARTTNNSTAQSAPSAADAPLRHYTSLADLGSAIEAQQRADRTQKISMTGGVGPLTLTGQGAIRFDDPGPSVQFSQHVEQNGQPGSGQDFAMVVLQNQVYLKPPATLLVLPPGRPWVQVSPNSTDPTIVQLDQLAQNMRQNIDPALAFKKLGDAASLVEAVDDPLDGTPAVRYRIRMDLAKAAQQQSDPTVREQLTEGLQSGITTVDVLTWVDAQDRTLRALVQQPIPGAQGTFTVDVHYQGWGQPVDISPPPADQVVPS
jgi:hypothetical protein